MPCSLPCPGHCPGRICSGAGATSRPGPAQLRLLRQHPPAPPLHNMAAAAARGTTGARPARRFEHTQEAAARGAMATAPVTSRPGHDVIARAPVSVSLRGGRRAGDCWVTEGRLGSSNGFFWSSGGGKSVVCPPPSWEGTGPGAAAPLELSRT